MNNQRNKKVVIGLSGGVDSSVAALLLMEQGFECVGVHVKTWDTDDGEAEKVSRYLSIPYMEVDMRKQFDESIVEYFTRSYESGQTPNPCIVCNPTIKWRALLSAANSVGAEFVATGHYAKIARTDEDRLALVLDRDNQKDQTYMLYRLTQDMLKRTLFPCGELQKTEIRDIAAKAGLFTSDKPDSQDICFINGDYRDFLKQAGIDEGQGNFVDEQGKVLGPHRGIIHFTTGQRKGLGIALGKTMTVINIDPVTKNVTLSADDFRGFNNFRVCDINYMGLSKIEDGTVISVKTRYSSKLASVKVSNEPQGLYCELSMPQSAISPGQSAVFYKDDLVAGGGIIYSLK